MRSTKEIKEKLIRSEKTLKRISDEIIEAGNEECLNDLYPFKEGLVYEGLTYNVRITQAVAQVEELKWVLSK
jgi:hypothetical protein